MFSASVGEQIIGSPRRVNEVFSDTTLSIVGVLKVSQRSRNLTFLLMQSATPATLGQPMIERPPRARGPNSIRPWNQATGLASTMILAMRCGMLSICLNTGLLG